MTLEDDGTIPWTPGEDQVGTAHVIVLATDIRGAAGAQELDITVSQGAPIAGFEARPEEGTAPLTVHFTDKTSGTTTSWLWDFGDLGTSTFENPSHTYNAGGDYTVSLTVTGPGGQDTETKVGHVHVTTPPPVAEFTAEPTSGHLLLANSACSEYNALTPSN